MKKYRCVQALMLVAISVFLLCGCNDSPTDPYNEGISTVTKQTTWLDSAGNTHTADFYTAGKSAGELKFDSSGIQMNHIFIDDILCMKCTQMNGSVIRYYFCSMAKALARKSTCRRWKTM